MGDALTPTREAEKWKRSGGVFEFGVESYYWEKSWEQNSKKRKRDTGRNLATKMVL